MGAGLSGSASVRAETYVVLARGDETLRYCLSPMGRDLRRTCAIVALVCGGFVILAEVPYWTTRSSLAPVLTALAVAVIALSLIELGRAGS